MGEGAWNEPVQQTGTPVDTSHLTRSTEHRRKPAHPTTDDVATVPGGDVQFPLTGQLPAQMQLPDHYPSIQEVIVGPSATEHDQINQAFASANQFIHAEWFRITDPASNNALVTAKTAGSDVQVIEDRTNMSSPSSQQSLAILQKGGITPQLSSTGFDISHSKAAAISSTADGPRTIIGSMNLTGEDARDIEFITNDSGILNSVQSVFQTDLKNAANGTTDTPTGLDPALVVSPINAEDKLSGLIYSVDSDPKKGWVIANAENWGDPVIQKALLDVAAHGIPVKVLGPEFDQNPNPAYNYPFLKALQTGGVQAKWMPDPGPGENPKAPIHPYEHLKSIVVMTPNGPVGYVGSINFSFQSAHQVDSPTTAGSKVKPNRELGILFNDTAAINAVEQAFNTDFGNAALLPATAPPAESKERKAPN